MVPFKPIISYNFWIARVVHFGLGCCLLASRPLNHVGDVGGILPLKLAGRLTCYHEILEKCPHRVFTTVWRSWFHMGQRRIYFLIRCVCFFYFAFFPLFRT